MEKTTYSYELMFVVDLTNGEEAAKATVNKFTSLMAENGEIVDIADWGKRRLAYPINDMNEGYFTVVTFKADASFPAELERLFNIDETVMRSIVLRLEHEAVAKAVVAEEVAEDVPAEAPVAEEAAAADAE